MEQPPLDLWFMMVAMSTASTATWLALAVRWWSGQPLLAYVPRTPVPWGAPVAMLAVVFVALTLLSVIGAKVAAEEVEIPHALEIAERLVGMILFQSVVIGGIMYFVVVQYQPTLSDLGLPVYADEMVRDIKIGVIAFLAAIGPVHGLNMLMFSVFGPSEHPLVEMVVGGEPNVGILFLAMVAAVLVAPISEEILFRLLFQGWLEKAADRAVVPFQETANDEARMTIAEFTLQKDSSFVIHHSSLNDTTTLDQPPSPRGWLPIFISSLLFALAHFGHGPDPIALFVLASILGFVYHRTHRIVPCIVAHGLFNLLTMLLLWRIVFVGVE